MIHAKPWEGALAQIEERRGVPRHRRIAHQVKHKGRPPQRRCPEDFDIIFVEIGRLDCENWYRASRITVNRWLAERGKARLIDLRAKFVRHQRDMAKPVVPVAPIARSDRVAVSPALAAMAANYLRASRNGGWMISTTPQGDWFVGSCRRSSGELLAMAERKGFDAARANLQIAADAAVRAES